MQTPGSTRGWHRQRAMQAVPPKAKLQRHRSSSAPQTATQCPPSFAAVQAEVEMHSRLRSANSQAQVSACTDSIKMGGGAWLCWALANGCIIDSVESTSAGRSVRYRIPVPLMRSSSYRIETTPLQQNLNHTRLRRARPMNARPYVSRSSRPGWPSFGTPSSSSSSRPGTA